MRITIKTISPNDYASHLDATYRQRPAAADYINKAAWEIVKRNAHLDTSMGVDAQMNALALSDMVADGRGGTATVEDVTIIATISKG